MAFILEMLDDFCHKVCLPSWPLRTEVSCSNLIPNDKVAGSTYQLRVFDDSATASKGSFLSYTTTYSTLFVILIKEKNRAFISEMLSNFDSTQHAWFSHNNCNSIPQSYWIIEAANSICYQMIEIWFPKFMSLSR